MNERTAGWPLSRRGFRAAMAAMATTAAMACGGSSGGGSSTGGSNGAGTVNQLDVSTDAHNCGAAGNVCVSGVCSGGACVSPIVRRVSTDSTAVMQGLAVDGSSVYWFEPVWQGSDILYRAPVSGGAAAALDASHTPVQIELVGSELVFGDKSTGSPTPSTGLHVMASSGGTVTDLEAEATLRVFGADAAGVCWGTYQPYHVSCAALSGGTPVQIATPAGYVDDVAVDGDRVYWIFLGDIYYAPRAGGGTTSTLANGVHAQSLQVHDGWMYFSGGATMFSQYSGVFRVPLAGGPVETIVTNRVGVCGFATDGATVYWSDCGNTEYGQMLKVPVTGGTAVPVTGLVPVPHSVAIDAGGLYWNDYAHIWRVAR